MKNVDFYVVWRFIHNENGTISTSREVNPIKLHSTLESAKEEAERLAGRTYGINFTVCGVKLIGNAITSKVEWTVSKEPINV